MIHPPRPQGATPRTEAQRAKSGFTLIEVMVTMAVMLIGFLALTSTTLVVHHVDQVDQGRRRASAALRSAVQRIQSRSAAAIEDEDGWAVAVTTAYLAGGDPGPTFDVEGLDPWDGLANVGSIEVVTDETQTDAALETTLGMPRDLDLDGSANNTDVSVFGQLLPVIVRVRWTGSGGQEEIVQSLWISRM